MNLIKRGILISLITLNVFASFYEDTMCTPNANINHWYIDREYGLKSPDEKDKKRQTFSSLKNIYLSDAKKSPLERNRDEFKRLIEKLRMIDDFNVESAEIKLTACDLSNIDVLIFDKNMSFYLKTKYGKVYDSLKRIQKSKLYQATDRQLKERSRNLKDFYWSRRTFLSPPVLDAKESMGIALQACEEKEGIGHCDVIQEHCSTAKYPEYDYQISYECSAYSLD